MAESETFDYEMRLVDHVSGPAHEESKALEGLTDTLKETAEHLGFAVGGAELFAKGIEFLGDAALESAKKLGEMGLEATKFAIEAAEFKENTIAAYAAVQGTADEGEATFKQLDKLAGAIHLPAKQVHQLARDLMLQGLEDTKLIGATIGAQAALLRTGQTEGAEKLKKIVERSLASGHFDVGKGLAGGKGGAASGRALAGLGIHLPELISDLAKRTGKSIGQVQLELKKGTISTETGIAALSDAINKGVVGKYAAAKFDIRDFTTDVGNFFTRMVQDIDLTKLEEGLAGVASTLGFVADKKGGVQAVFQAIVDWSGKAIEKATELGLDIVIAFLKAEIAAGPLIHAIQDVYHWIEKVIGGLDRAGHAIIDFEKSIPGVGSAIKAAEGTAHTTITPGELGTLAIPGVGAVYGMIKGLEISTANSAHEMGLDMGKNAVSGAREGANAHSPSDDMKDLGKDMTDGLSLGFNSKTTSDAMSMGPSSGAIHSVSVDVGGIHLVGGEDPHTTMALLESQIADIFERVSLELGQNG